MMAKLVVYLSDPEWAALRAMAESQMRGMREQARYLLREAAARQGLLPAEAQFQSAEQQREKGQDIEQ